MEMHQLEYVLAVAEHNGLPVPQKRLRHLSPLFPSRSVSLKMNWVSVYS